MATPPTTGKRAAYTGRVKIWPRKSALKSAVKRGSPACQTEGNQNETARQTLEGGISLTAAGFARNYE